MTQCLAVLSLALLGSEPTFGPQYTFEAVPDIYDFSPARVNSSGNLCASSTYISSSKGGHVTSESGIHSWMRVNGSTVFFDHGPFVNLLDINDNNIAVGTVLPPPLITKLCVTDGRKITPIEVPVTPLHRAFMNTSGEIAFQAKGQPGKF